MDGLMKARNDEIYADGLAIGQCDIRREVWYFRFGDETFEIDTRCKNVAVFTLPELPHAVVAKIEEVRRAAL